MAALILLLGVGAGPLSGCSDDDDQRDVNYGTDVGAGYQLPDGGVDTGTGQAGGDGPGASGDAVDTSGTQADADPAVADAENQPDAPSADLPADTSGNPFESTDAAAGG